MVGIYDAMGDVVTAIHSDLRSYLVNVLFSSSTYVAIEVVVSVAYGEQLIVLIRYMPVGNVIGIMGIV